MRGQQYSRSRRHSWWPPRPPWIILVSLSLLVNFTHSSITCGYGINTPGGTFPRGDIVLEYGNGVPLEITCVLDPEHSLIQSLIRDQMYATPDVDEPPMLSQRIIFYKHKERVSKQYVSIVNATAAKMHIPNPPAGHDTYSCTIDSHRRQNRSSGGGLNTSSAGSEPVVPPQPMGGEQSPFSTIQPTSLETSGPPPVVSKESEIGVCLNSVAVGYKPLPITNFSCISDNWVSLTCNWTKPENPIKTEYTLFFRLPGRAGGRTIINCPTNSDVLRNTCYWDFATEPIYRQPYEYYYFTLTGKNELGVSNTSIRFHHYANIIPASPTNITVVEKTQSSALLRWSVGTMTSFPKELIHKIEYKSQWDSNPEHWTSVNVTDICNTSSTSNQSSTAQSANLNCRERDSNYNYFNVTGLKYLFTYYDFRIYVRSSVARGEDKWSAPGVITLKTKPSIPRRPPRTDVGSFECIISPVDKTKRDVFIYWQNIDDSEKCGDLFEYQAYYTTLTADNQTKFHRSNETYKTYAKFEGLNTDVGYNFIVYSSNKEGRSTEYSTVYVPRESDKLDEPLSFTKMVFDERGVFELSWKNASSHKLSSDNQLSDYTIFWCENDKDRPYQCNGYMNWTHVPRTESCHNVTVTDYKKVYQFAISANSQSLPRNGFSSLYKPSSSGMVWASCTVMHDTVVGKIKNVWVNTIGSTFMELRWKLDCSDRINSVLGFRIFYCPVVSINNSACKEPMLNKTVSGDMGLDSRGIANLTNLKAYTTYMVTIALITKHGEGLHSDPLLNTTLEGAPDIQNVKIAVLNLTNTSVTLQWSPPKLTNGIVRHYNVYYYLNDVLHQKDSSESLDDPSVNERHVEVRDTKYTLEHLESYRNYMISVTACTTICSEHSTPVPVQTAVGVPGRIAQPDIFYENSTRIAVSWSKPQKPAGPVDCYELIVVHHSGPTNSQITNGGSSFFPTALASAQMQGNPNHNLYQIDSTMFHVPIPDCNDEQDNGQQTYIFAVRAVNNNPLDPSSPYNGPWSNTGSYSCMLPGLPLALHIVIWSCLFIVLTTVSTYWGNRFWKKYKVMQNVQVVLPPTLNLNFKFDHYNNFDDHALDSPDQHFCVEDGHIIYDASPTDPAVVYNASACGGIAVASAAADRTQPASSRWSPATATTTITATDDDDSSSSKHRLILPSSLPKRDSFSDATTNNVKSNADDSGNVGAETSETVVEDEVVPHLEPVLPFFSLPESTMTMTKPSPMMPVTASPSIGLLAPSPRLDFGSGGGASTSGYQDCEIANSLYRDLSRAVKTHGGGVVVIGDRDHGRGATAGTVNATPLPVLTAIDCFVGDQRQVNDKDLLRRPTVGNSPSWNVGSNGDQKEDVLSLEQPVIAAGEIHRHEQGSDEVSSPYHMDDRRQQHQQQQKLQQQQQPPQPSSQQQQHQQQPLPPPPPPVPAQRQQQQTRRNDGYCGKQVMIAAAANDLGKKTAGRGGGGGGGDPPPAASTTLLASSSAYVMLDMVTAAAAQKRLLDMQNSGGGGGGNSGYKPAISVAVQPTDVVACVVQPAAATSTGGQHDHKPAAAVASSS